MRPFVYSEAQKELAGRDGGDGFSAEFELGRQGRSGRHRLMAEQLEVLKGICGLRAMVWRLTDTEDFELAQEPLFAAQQALEQLDAQMTAQIPGYPPPTVRAFI